MKNEGPIHGNYKIRQDYFNNPKRIKLMKKINWQAVWIIIKNILIALLTANALEQRL